jgi:type IV secretion system protein VirD4
MIVRLIALIVVVGAVVGALLLLAYETGRHPFMLGVPLLVFLFGVLFYRMVLGRKAQVRQRSRALRWRIRLRLRPGRGYASLAELWWHWGRRAALEYGRHSRPGLQLRHRLILPTTHYAVRFGRAQYGRRAYGSEQRHVLIVSPPRVGKSGLLADWILSHQGPVLVTTTRGDLYKLTAAVRSRGGRCPVDVFNPQGVAGIPSTFAWDLLGACRDVLAAHRMAQWLTGGITNRGGHSDLQWFEQKGDVALGVLLWTAANGGYTITDVYRWVLLDGHEAALHLLATHPDSSREMLSIARRVFAEDRTHASIRATMELSLAWATVPQLAAAVIPGHTRGFDLDRFLACDGSVYLVASGDEDSPLTPLFRAFGSWLHYSAGLEGTLTPAGRLYRPLLEALDELAVVCPVNLPGMLADSAGKGIRIAAVLHSNSQAADRWGEHGQKTVWALCGTKIFFGEISDPDTLDDASKLCGSVIIGRDDRPVDSVPVVPPDLLRTLPATRALIICGRLLPIVVKTRPAWNRLRYRLGRLVPLYQPLVPVLVEEPVSVPEAATAPELPVLAASGASAGFPYAGSLNGSGGDG